MARKRARAKKKQSSWSQKVVWLLTGSALTLCALSVMYGFLIRQSVAEHNVSGLRIEVLNGTKENGLARLVATSLMRQGVDVLDTDNADNDAYEESILIARRSSKHVEALGRALGCGNVIVQLDDDSFVDATLIIGRDHGRLNLSE